MGDRRDHEEKETERFPLAIEEATLKRRAVAAVDASVEDRCMTACGTIANLNNEPRIEGIITSSNWAHGSITVAEKLGFLT